MSGKKAITILPRYSDMRLAVAECVRIDEAKDISDRAAALAAYARQRDDKELEAWVGEIRCRAHARIGELSRELPKAEVAGGRNGEPELRLPIGGKSKAAALAEAGLSTSVAQRCEEVAGEPTKAEAYYNDCKANGIVPTLNGLRAVIKQDRRASREREFAEITKMVMQNLGTKTYGVIYADPPWRFEPYSRDTGMDRAADNHYDTMDLDAIKAMAVPAAPNCVLFLWATSPMLPEALEVMEAWGFAYKSHFVWAKDRIGTGYWARNQHELLLIGTKGDIPAPAPGQQYSSVIEAKVGKHSAKPACFAEMIEEMFPNVPAVELFARGQRLGWDAWGNEVA